MWNHLAAGGLYRGEWLRGKIQGFQSKRGFEVEANSKRLYFLNLRGGWGVMPERIHQRKIGVPVIKIPSFSSLKAERIKKQNKQEKRDKNWKFQLYLDRPLKFKYTRFKDFVNLLDSDPSLFQ